MWGAGFRQRKPQYALDPPLRPPYLCVATSWRSMSILAPVISATLTLFLYKWKVGATLIFSSMPSSLLCLLQFSLAKACSAPVQGLGFGFLCLNHAREP